MSRGRRLLTDEQERELLAKVALREQLTDTALAKDLDIPVSSLRRVLYRLRWQGIASDTEPEREV